MATRLTTKTTFEISRTIEPIYTGGEVSANATGSLLATTVEDGVHVIEVKTGRTLLRIDGDGESITSLALSPTSSHLVACSRSLSMRIFALTIGETSITADLLRTLKPHTSPVVSSNIDSTGTLLVTGGADGIAKVWDIRGGYCSHTFHGHGGLVTAVHLFEFRGDVLKKSSSTGKKRKNRDGDDTAMTNSDASSTILLATGDEEGKIKIWDLSTRKSISTLDSHVSVVRSIKYSPERRQLLSVSRDKTIVTWDTKTWQPLRIIPTLEVLESGGFLPGGIYCYGGGEHGRSRVWDAETGEEVTKTREPGTETEMVVTIIEISDEDALLTIHQDQTMTLQSYQELGDLVSGVIEALPILRRISGNHDEIIDMACIGPDRSRLALATNTESIKIITIQGGEDEVSKSEFGSDIALLEGHQDIIICMDVDWSGHWLATGAKDNTARLWRLDPERSLYQCFATFAGHAESLGAIALPRTPPISTAAAKDPLNHPPSYLITGSQDKTIKRWDTSKLTVSPEDSEPHSIAKAMYTRVAHEKDINAIDISPIAPLFASASQDRTIKIWSLEDGSTAGILRGHKRGVWSVAFSPAGSIPINLSEGGNSSTRGLLVSGSGDRTVKVWSLSTYTCLLTFEGHSNSVLKVIWLAPPGLNEDTQNPNQQRHDQAKNQPVIASASSDTLVKLWDPYASLDSDHLLTTLDNHTDRVWSLASPLPAIATQSKSSPSPPFNLISGAADASLTFWRDTTTQTQQATTQAMTLRIEQDQLLQNHIHAKNYRESIVLSLKLNHPARLLSILSTVINTPDSEKEPDSITGVRAVDDVLASLSQEELYLLLTRVRDWNVNARTAPVAQRVLNVLFKRYPTTLWAEMARNRNLGRRRDGDAPTVPAGAGTATAKPMSMRDLFRALEVYTERHYKRMEELVDESYLIEYTLREMDEVAGTVAMNGGDDEPVSGADQILMNGPAKKMLELRSKKRVNEGEKGVEDVEME